MRQRLLVIQIAGLGCTAVSDATPNLRRLAEQGSGPIPVQPPVPALTSPSQVTLSTGSLPEAHGIVGNGWYFRELATILNWQRSAELVQAQPLWEVARRHVSDLRCANLFWRYATHSQCEAVVIERPTYWANGRKSPDFYTEPSELHDELTEQLGPFPLFRFWGPAAGIASTEWIADATCMMLRRDEFDLVLTYLPHLDYDHQRFGPTSTQATTALSEVDRVAGRLIDAAAERGMRVAVVSDYAFEPVKEAVYLNRILRDAGLLRVHRAENGELLECGISQAFAVCDQQVAHIYVAHPRLIERVRELLQNHLGVAEVLDREALRPLGLDHPRAGELLAIAEPGCWFAYPYWMNDADAPDFSRCVAIHDKPGFDPGELFASGKVHLAKRVLQSKIGLRVPFDVVSRDDTLVRGSHGRIPTTDKERPVFICDWPLSVQKPLPMQNIRGHLLKLFQPAE